MRMSISKLIVSEIGGDRMDIAHRRKVAGLTQAELAQKLNVDQSAVSNWERGVNRPLKKYWPQLARAFDCSVEALLTDDNMAGKPSKNS